MGLNFSFVTISFLAVLSLRWTATAAQAGPRSIALWFLAGCLFLVPQVNAVAQMSKRLGVGSGLYGWVRDEWGPFHGFLCGWCYWVNNLIYFPALLLFMNANLALAFGQEPEALGRSGGSAMMFLTLSELGFMAFLSSRGVGISRAVQRAGMVGNWIPWFVLVILASAIFFLRMPAGAAGVFEEIVYPAGLRGTAADYSLFASLCFALAGFELLSFYAEGKSDRTRSLFFAALLVIFVYVVGTLSILVGARANAVTNLNGVVVAISGAAESLGLPWLVLPVGLMMALAVFCGTFIWFRGAAEIPYWVGVDRFLPNVFSRRHPRWGTPTIAIAVQALIATAFTILATAGELLEQSYRTLCDVCLVVYFIPYLYLFSTHLRILCRPYASAARWVFLAAVLSGVGFLATVLAVTMSLFPSGLGYEMAVAPRTLLGSSALVGSGLIVYWRGAVRQRSLASGTRQGAASHE